MDFFAYVLVHHNFKLWMKYFACCHCDDMLFEFLIPIPMSVYLDRTKIFCLMTNSPSVITFPSRTTWCISSNASEGVDFCDNWIIPQLLKDSTNGQ